MNFYDNLERYGQSRALIAEDGKEVSYLELARDADAVGFHLRERGLGFALCENRPESVAGYLGFLRSRTPVALLASGLHETLLAELLKRYRPQYVWLPRERAGLISNAANLVELGRYVLLAGGTDPFPCHDDLALLLTTSGSTGSPKFVRQTYGNIASNADSITQYLGIRSEDKPITTLPMHYVFGLSVINSHLLSGASVVLTNRGLMEKAFWNLLKLSQATSFSGVPYTYEMLKRLRFGRMDLPSLKVLTQAGGKLNADLVYEFAVLCREKGIRFFVMYGASEATARMSYLPADSALEKPGSIGIPIPGGEFWIEDENGARIDSPGVVGELIYRGANVSPGYATCGEDLALGDVNGGILRTGDMAKRDEDGFYYIAGRMSRFLKIFGNRVALEEVEQHIRKLGIDCACTGEDDRLKIYISDGSDRNRAIGYVQELTGLHHTTYAVVVVDKIPRNEFGKITYAELP